MSRRKVSTTIYITPEQADRLKLLHERTKVPIAVYIREGIELVLKHYEHVLPGQMTLESATPQAPPVRVAAPRGAGGAAGGRAAVAAPPSHRAVPDLDGEPASIEPEPGSE
jgi:predicted DNA-binding protein